MRFDVLTLFPDFFTSPLGQGIMAKAVAKGVFEVRAVNIRDYATDKHKTADDYPYGGGCGMVMKVEPVISALEDVRARCPGKRPHVILTTPQGRPFGHEAAKELSLKEWLVIICGRYEGIDERVREFADDEISIGDYILTGGETAALAIIEAVGRLLPGALGEPESMERESFSRGLLEYPQYTRPEDFRGMKVPAVLLSGNHKEIERWRTIESVKRTLSRRPDLADRIGLEGLDDETVRRMMAEEGLHLAKTKDR